MEKEDGKLNRDHTLWKNSPSPQGEQNGRQADLTSLPLFLPWIWQLGLY